MKSKFPGSLEFLARGAEARLYLVEWFGRKSVLKLREAKAYRLPDVDRYIRRRRTYAEAKAMITARRLGVPTPALYYVNLEEGAIVMEYVEGARLRELLYEEEGESLLIKLGEYVGLMHLNGLLHGDPSPANVMVRGGGIVIIDFGLAELTTPDLSSRRYVEKLAVDLNVLFRSLESTYGSRGERMKSYVIAGYRDVLGSLADRVVDTVNSIRKRARYVERRR